MAKSHMMKPKRKVIIPTVKLENVRTRKKEEWNAFSTAPETEKVYVRAEHLR